MVSARLLVSLGLLDSSRTVKPRKDGSDHRFIKVTASKRNKFGIPDRSQKPFTSRAGVQMRGIAKQITPINFIHELLDVKLAEDCAKRNVPLDAELNEWLMADVRQDAGYQSVGGGNTLLSGSRMFHFRRDRCWVAHEHLFAQGWGHDVDVAGINEDIIKELEKEVADPVAAAQKKRRMGRKPDWWNVLTGLAGNQICLPDMAHIVMPVLLAVDIGQFEKPLTMSDLDAVSNVHEDESARASIELLDPNMDQAALRKIEKRLAQLGDAEGGDGSASD